MRRASASMPGSTRCVCDGSSELGKSFVMPHSAGLMKAVLALCSSGAAVSHALWDGNGQLNATLLPHLCRSERAHS
ncbi:hypothetical protein MHYP_G00209440 [Metynnis hypsauchen]